MLQTDAIWLAYKIYAMHKKSRAEPIFYFSLSIKNDKKNHNKNRISIIALNAKKNLPKKLHNAVASSWF